MSRAPLSPLPLLKLKKAVAQVKEFNVWKIPISMSYPGQQSLPTTASTWLLEPSQDISVDHKPYILNVKGTGYYRVNYDEENWSLLIEELKSNAKPNINRLNRAQMIDDIMNLARAGKVDYNLALSLLQYLNIEDDYPLSLTKRNFFKWYDRDLIH